MQEKIYFAEYIAGEHVVLSFDKNKEDDSIYVIEDAYIDFEQDDQ